MKKLIKVLMTLILFVLILALIAGILVHETRPEGTSGPEAEALTDSMLSALNYQAYRDSIMILSWSYRGVHHYQWNRQTNEVTVSWENHVVIFNNQTLDGTALKEGVTLKGEKLRKAIEDAWRYFVNDSFWLVAPFKIRDPGTKRTLVETEEGPSLLVTYTSGGVTPGDSYLWHLDDNYLPKSWQMWVEILPIGGVEFSWEGWTELNGAKFSTFHKGPAAFKLELSNLEVE